MTPMHHDRAQAALHKRTGTIDITLHHLNTDLKMYFVLVMNFICVKEPHEI